MLFNIHQQRFLSVLLKPNNNNNNNNNDSTTNNSNGHNDSNNRLLALSYGKQYLSGFMDTHLEQIQKLFGCLLFEDRLQTSPYKDHYYLVYDNTNRSSDEYYNDISRDRMLNQYHKPYYNNHNNNNNNNYDEKNHHDNDNNTDKDESKYMKYINETSNTKLREEFISNWCSCLGTNYNNNNINNANAFRTFSLFTHHYLYYYH